MTVCTNKPRNQNGGSSDQKGKNGLTAGDVIQLGNKDEDSGGAYDRV